METGDLKFVYLYCNTAKYIPTKLGGLYTVVWNYCFHYKAKFLHRKFKEIFSHETKRHKKYWASAKKILQCNSLQHIVIIYTFRELHCFINPLIIIVLGHLFVFKILILASSFHPDAQAYMYSMKEKEVPAF